MAKFGKSWQTFKAVQKTAFFVFIPYKTIKYNYAYKLRQFATSRPIVKKTQ